MNTNLTERLQATLEDFMKAAYHTYPANGPGYGEDLRYAIAQAKLALADELQTILEANYPDYDAMLLHVAEKIKEWRKE
jgi:hypothetical protein